MHALSHPIIRAGDGVVRVYRNYSGQTEDAVELVTAWRALNDRIRVKRGSGLVLHWQQDHGVLLAAGDTRNVRVWDAHREVCLQVRTVCPLSSRAVLSSNIFRNSQRMQLAVSPL